jgi:hypothetical protein
MAAVSLRRRVVFLARAGCAEKVTKLKGLQELKRAAFVTFLTLLTNLTCAQRCASLKPKHYGNDPR